MQELTKMTNGTVKENDADLHLRIDTILKESKILSQSLEVERRNSETQDKRIKKLESLVESLQKDLDLSSPRYGNISTRELARQAFNQSTSEANWESLAEHSVIKGIYDRFERTDKRITHETYSLKQRLDGAQPANEVFKALKDHSVIQKLQEEISGTKAELDFIRTKTNKHDMEQRTKISDLQLMQETLEFKLSEINDMFMNGFLFAIGAFATLGYDKVGEGLKDIIHPRKEVKPKNE